MAYNSNFFDAVETSPGIFDRVYPASTFARRFNAYFKDGIILDNAVLNTELEVTSNGDMTTNVDLGMANIKGYTIEVTPTAETVTHSTADPSLNRIDRVVLQLSNDPSIRLINIIVKEGEPSSSPNPPYLTRTLVGDIYTWELSLAQVYIPAGATAVGTIIDERLDASVCGISDLTIAMINASNVIVDNSNFINLTGADGQTVFEEIDSKLGANIYTNLSQIGLTDDDFIGKTQVTGLLLLWNNIPNNSIFQINCIGSLQASVSPFADDSKVQGVLRITKQTSTLYMACEYFRRSTRDLNDVDLPSQRTSQSFTGSFDSSQDGNDRWSGWRISSGSYLINAVLAPGSERNFSALTTANAVIIRVRTSPDNENDRTTIIVPRNKSDQLVGNRFGKTAGYFGAVKINFFDGTIVNSVISDDVVRIDSLTII